MADPYNNAIPSVSGTATVGNALFATNGNWVDPDGDPMGYTYKWYRADDTNGTNASMIVGATSSSYTLTASDAHKYVRVVVTASDGNGGTPTATSLYTAITNSAPVNTLNPSVTGTATVGGALTATNGVWSDPDGDSRTFTYKWYRADDTNGTNLAVISGATAATYTLTTSDAHRYVRVVVTANDGHAGTQLATSMYTTVANSAPVNSGAPSVTGTATVGGVISTTNGVWSDPDGDSRSFTYQWYRAADSNGLNDTAVSGATSSSYTLTASDARKYLRVVVTASDNRGGTQVATSMYATVANSAPVMSTTARTATAINEDDTTNGGTTVATLLASAGTATDAEGGTLGIAITDVDNTNGTWEYKTGAGSWTAITGAAATTALLLAPTDSVRFVPTANYNGSSTGGISFKAWDRTAGTAGTTAGNDTTANGGKGADGQYSTNSATAAITVNAVNDAPVLSDTVVTLDSVGHTAGVPSGAVGTPVSSLVAIGTNVSDVDSGAVTGIAITALDTSEGGTWYKGIDSGSGTFTWHTVGAVSTTSAMLLRPTDRLYYKPSGTGVAMLSSAVTFKAWDQSSGSAGSTADSTSGTAFSAATDTAALTITLQAPGVPVLAAASDTGASNSDRLTKATTATFTGTGAVPTTTVRLYNVGTLLATTTSIGDGSFTFSDVDVSGLTGAVTLTTRQVLAGEESGDSSSLGVTFDRSAPGAPAVTGITTDSGASGSDGITADTTLVIAGTAEANSTVTVKLDGTALGTAPVNGSGVWSYDHTGTTLPAGSYAITATAADAAGNVSAASGTFTATVDPDAPTLATATVNGTSLVLTYSDATNLDAVNLPAAGAFSVTVAGAPVVVNAVATNAVARTVTLTLASAVTHGQTVAVSYTDQAGDDAVAIQDLAGNDAATLTNQAVTNNTPAPPSNDGGSDTPRSETVDGVPVQTGTVTHSDGSTSQTVTIPVVTAARNEQVGNNSVADIPLVTSGGANLLTAQVPTGFGLAVSGTGTPKAAGSSLSDLVREIQAHTAAGSADQTQLTGGGSGFLQGLPTNAPLLVQTIVPTTAPGATAPGAPLVITGTPAGTGATTALVIDARSLPAGSELQLQNVDFAAVVGAVRVTGGDGSQKVWGDSANQTIILGADDDTLHGGGGDDYVGSKTGNDVLYGDEGNDTVSGGEDNDTLYGNTGKDLLYGGKGSDELHGGKDGDVLYGDLGNDVLYGDLGADDLNGNAGDDLVNGNQENDTVHGGQGNDTVRGGQGNDQVFGDLGNDVLYGDLGADDLNGNAGDDLVNGNQENDTVHGGQGNDTVRGGQGNDQVFGDLGNDALWGDYGDDTLSGGAGADVFWIRSGDGHDVITDFNAAEGDRIGLQDGLSYTTRSNAAGEAVIVFSDGNDLTLQGIRLSAFSSTIPASWVVRG